MVARVCSEAGQTGLRAALDAAPERLLRWSVAAAFLAEGVRARLTRRSRSARLRVNAGLSAGLAAAAGLGLAAGAGVASAAFAPSKGEAVAALFAPWLDAEDAAERVFRAGGLVIADTDQAWPIYAAGVSDDFLDRLRAQGAWMVMDADGAETLFGARR